MIFLALGGAIALSGVAALVWIALRARAVGAADLMPEARRAAWRKLMALNAAAVGLAFLGLAVMVLAGLL